MAGQRSGQFVTKESFFHLLEEAETLSAPSVWDKVPYFGKKRRDEKYDQLVSLVSLAEAIHQNRQGWKVNITKGRVYGEKDFYGNEGFESFGHKRMSEPLLKTLQEFDAAVDIRGSYITPRPLAESSDTITLKHYKIPDSIRERFARLYSDARTQEDF